MKDMPDELDLHGLTVDEAIPLVDTFLYQSYKAGLRHVWVIHGRGTGWQISKINDFKSNFFKMFYKTIIS